MAEVFLEKQASKLFLYSCNLSLKDTLVSIHNDSTTCDDDERSLKYIHLKNIGLVLFFIFAFCEETDYCM